MSKITVIAEIGVNHGGSMDYARKAIEEAKRCGCDIAKFQLYHPESLFPNHEVIVNSRNWYPEVEKTELSFEQVSMLKNHCDKVGIEFMASAFDTKRLQWLELLHVKRHKIASPMNTNKEYIERVLSLGKETLFSATYDEVTHVPGSSLATSKILKMMYCMPQYPTKLSELNFYNLDAEQRYDTGFLIDFYDGFSDHTIGIEAATFAMARGITIIEKHFKLSESEVGPDMIVSITPAELRCLVKFARAFEEIIQ